MRPHYPAALFDKLVADTRLPAQAELLEIGPGTGQATKPLATRGYHITAVELGDSMATKARDALAGFPNVRIITGAFEDIALPDGYYDLVYAATAIHWVKPEYKFIKPHQLIKPGGHLAIIHTEHISDEQGDAFFFASQPMYQKYHATDKPNNKQRYSILPRLRDLQPPESIDTKLFSVESFTTFPLTVTYSAQTYVDLLATFSPHLALPAAKRARFFEDVKALIDKDFDGRLAKRYAMTLTLAARV